MGSFNGENKFMVHGSGHFVEEYKVLINYVETYVGQQPHANINSNKYTKTDQFEPSHEEVNKVAQSEVYSALNDCKGGGC